MASSNGESGGELIPATTLRVSESFSTSADHNSQSGNGLSIPQAVALGTVLVASHVFVTGTPITHGPAKRPIEYSSVASIVILPSSRIYESGSSTDTHSVGRDEATVQRDEAIYMTTDSVNGWTQSERTLKTSANFAFLCLIALLALMVVGFVHWVLWVPAAISCVGVLLSNGIQLNRIQELRGERPPK